MEMLYNTLLDAKSIMRCFNALRNIVDNPYIGVDIQACTVAFSASSFRSHINLSYTIVCNLNVAGRKCSCY